MKRRTTKYTVVIVSVVLCVAVMAICSLLYRLLRGDVQEESHDIADYGQWSLSDKYSHLLIFPEEIPESAKQVEYYYKYEDGWTRPMCQIYLSYTLDGEDYEKEERRLSSLSWESEDQEFFTVQRDVVSFQSPAYVTIAGYDFCYEYALMYEEEHTIVYIYSMNTVEGDLNFNQEFLPNYYMEGFEDLSVQGTDRFTMYGGYELPSGNKE